MESSVFVGRLVTIIELLFTAVLIKLILASAIPQRNECKDGMLLRWRWVGDLNKISSPCVCNPWMYESKFPQFVSSCLIKHRQPPVSKSGGGSTAESAGVTRYPGWSRRRVAARLASSFVMRRQRPPSLRLQQPYEVCTYQRTMIILGYKP